MEVLKKTYLFTSIIFYFVFLTSCTSSIESNNTKDSEIKYFYGDIGGACIKIEREAVFDIDYRDEDRHELRMGWKQSSCQNEIEYIRVKTDLELNVLDEPENLPKPVRLTKRNYFGIYVGSYGYRKDFMKVRFRGRTSRSKLVSEAKKDGLIESLYDNNKKYIRKEVNGKIKELTECFLMDTGWQCVFYFYPDNPYDYINSFSVSSSNSINEAEYKFFWLNYIKDRIIKEN